ncbi:NAD(P)/FAD-dependent oxidoreductase [Halococcus saccharolyticus]|uniref:FAD dependent oxidoreductase n=1 Tax=Halococcus saccharolyticus DSM 5350 TaxID=1227455 RepID=M0MMP9_9EURY|nr:FAD-dependent oxidoreductase [Halococcus saccharolyticus]EMA46643.1 FAD dependent oxidoreductase [Halococcus saccharolyticus DSM 5350]
MNVVVVGGGIVGLSSAHALAEAGADVTLCESGSLGTGSTARSAGGIRTQFSTPINVRLSIESLRVWDRFEAAFGVDIAHRRPGYLFLARTPETADRFRENVAMQHDLGVDSEFLSPAEAVERCPGLDADQFVGATYNAADGFADPNLAVQGYATSAREAGVDIRTGTPVVDLVTDGDGVTGVETDAERIDADFVVNAAGAWAAAVADLAGVDLPIHPRRRQVAVVDPSRPLSADVPLTIDLERGSYFRPERDGAALVGGHFAETESDVDPDAYSDSMDLDWAATAVERAAAYTNYFDGDSRIRRGWAGLYAVTPDHHPIVEETVPGLITAAGFSGHGFQHAPATGRLVAELCTDGEASLVDIEPLSSRRFDDEGDELVEQNVA